MASAGPASGLIPRGRPSLVQPGTRRTPLAGGLDGRAVVTRSPHPGDEHATGSSSPGPGAVEHLERLLHAVEGLLERRGGRPSPLDLRLVPEDVALARDLDSRNRAWTDGVLAAMTAGRALDASIPEAEEASLARRALYALLDCLRYEVDLDELRDAWPQVRADLRCYVLGVVREDAPEDLEVLDRVLRACGIRPLHEPEPEVAAAGLRTLLRELLATRATDRARFGLRTALDSVHARGATAQLGRYLLARVLAEREPLQADEITGWSDAEVRALLREPRPERRPTLPREVVGVALVLLGVLDMAEARTMPDRSWRGRSAYNVLRVVSTETRWSDEQRAVMEAVIEGSVPPGEQLRQLIRGAVDALAGHENVMSDSYGGDGAETSKAPSIAGRTEVVSPGRDETTPGHGVRAGEPPGVGDGTETSGAQFRADHGEVSSPEPAAKQVPESQRPEDLALAYLMRAIREGRPCPSLRECAEAAGTSRQATAKWKHFRVAWENAKAPRGGRIRRGYRSARTGDIEAEADEG